MVSCSLFWNARGYRGRCPYFSSFPYCLPALSSSQLNQHHCSKAVSKIKEPLPKQSYRQRYVLSFQSDDWGGVTVLQLKHFGYFLLRKAFHQVFTLKKTRFGSPYLSMSQFKGAQSPLGNYHPNAKVTICKYSCCICTQQTSSLSKANKGFCIHPEVLVNTIHATSYHSAFKLAG